MRLISATAAFAIASVALYVALVWGLDAARILSAPIFDQPDYWRTQVYAIGSFMGLDRIGMLRFGIFFGAYALAISGLFAIHFIERLISVFGYRPDRGILYAGLFLILGESVLTTAAAQFYGLADLKRAALLNLSVAVVAITWSLAEWLTARPAQQPARTSAIDDPMPPNSFPIPAPDALPVAAAPSDFDAGEPDVPASAPLASSRTGGLRLVELKPDPAS
jgi:hypothetical protein